MTTTAQPRPKVLIVDDEPLARREVVRLLAAHPEVVIVGEASNIEEAEERIDALLPDLLLLDIQMPGGTGFDLLARLDNPPRVIFTTAHDEHAVRAFEVNALDYLLKPIEPERLAEALARMLASMSVIAKSSKPKVPETTNAGKLDRVFVRDGSQCWFVPMDEVRLLESEGNYTRLFWNDVTPMLGRSLIQLEERLDPHRFFRANRKQVIALDFVKQVSLGVGGRIHVELRGGGEVEISRRQARLFRERTSG